MSGTPAGYGKDPSPCPMMEAAAIALAGLHRDRSIGSMAFPPPPGSVGPWLGAFFAQVTITQAWTAARAHGWRTARVIDLPDLEAVVACERRFHGVST